MSRTVVNRAAEVCGELAFRARKGDVIALACLEQILHENGSLVNADELVLSGETLAALWRSRLTTPGGSADQPAAMHPTELGRLSADDYEPDPSGSGRTTATMSAESADRHSFRQAAYGALRLPAHPDVERAIANVVGRSPSRE